MTDASFERLETLRAATDRAAADDRASWAIIATLLAAISEDETTTHLAVSLLDSMSWTAPRAAV